MMKKMTKTQIRRALKDIKGKAFKVYVNESKYGSIAQAAPLSLQDLIAIEKICNKALKRVG